MTPPPRLNSTLTPVSGSITDGPFVPLPFLYLIAEPCGRMKRRRRRGEEEEDEEEEEEEEG